MGVEDMKRHVVLCTFVIAVFTVQVVAQEAHKPVVGKETEFRVTQSMSSDMWSAAEYHRELISVKFESSLGKDTYCYPSVRVELGSTFLKAKNAAMKTGEVKELRVNRRDTLEPNTLLFDING
jgi:hypothetical protein